MESETTLLHPFSCTVAYNDLSDVWDVFGQVRLIVFCFETIIDVFMRSFDGGDGVHLRTYWLLSRLKGVRMSVCKRGSSFLVDQQDSKYPF